MASRETQDKALKILKDWAIPTSVMLVAATGAWARFESVIAAHEKRLDKLDLDVSRSGECGGDGFLAPAAHVAHDQHIRHFFREELGPRGWLRFVAEYANGITSEAPK